MEDPEVNENADEVQSAEELTSATGKKKTRAGGKSLFCANGTKVAKLKKERTENQKKIDDLTARNAEIDAQVQKLETADLIALFQTSGQSLTEFLQNMQS